jgi:5-methyltetrahydropteroyltriglutamate--homocysteine methyltransferase
MADDFKYHIDHHSTLIPPPELLAARAARYRGELSADQLRAAEDQAIKDVLHTQRRLGLAALTDGQFRRRNALAPYYDRIEGFGAPEASPGPVAELLGTHLAPEQRPLVSTPKATTRLAENEAAFLVGAIDRSILIALPSPGFVAELSGANDADAAALAAIVHDELEALAKDGVAYVQLHNPLAAILLTTAGRDHARALGLEPDAILARTRATDAKAIDVLDVPETFRVGLDLTTAGTEYLKHGYDPDVAAAYFQPDQPYRRFCVEHPSDEAAQFPLSLLPPGTVVSLGIVDVSTPQLENVDDLVARIDQAATVIDIDDIAISTNGGFASSPTKLTEPEQRAKLQLVEMTARYFWGNEL